MAKKVKPVDPQARWMIDNLQNVLMDYVKSIGHESRFWDYAQKKYEDSKKEQKENEL